VVFALWIGVALGGAIDGWLLSFFGYQSSGVQTDHALLGIRMIASVASGATFLAVAACLLFYRIDKKLNLTIADELAERRKSFGSAS
jgi:GPH family glycoside/pentoside/hexuronide:cation symporter